MHWLVKKQVLQQERVLEKNLETCLNNSFKKAHADGHEFVVIRENTEGTYAGEGGFLRKGTAHEIATQGSVNTRKGAERCIRYGF